MILLVLAALWIVVLAPAGVKKVLERRSAVSIDSFQQQLHLLRRAGEPPVRRLQTVRSTTGLAVGQSGFPAVSSRPGRPNLVLLPPVVPSPEAGEPGEPAGLRWVGPDPVAMARRDEARRRSLVRRRRRDVLLGLVGTLVVSGLLGVAVPLCWAITVLAGLALAGYVGLAAYAQDLAAQRRSRGAAPVEVAEGWLVSAEEWELPRAAAGGR